MEVIPKISGMFDDNVCLILCKLFVGLGPIAEKEGMNYWNGRNRGTASHKIVHQNDKLCLTPNYGTTNRDLFKKALACNCR